MKILTAIALVCSLSSFAAVASVWDSANDPRLLLKDSYVANFYSLPLQATLASETRLWSDDFWARNKGGIAFRWQTHESPFSYDLKGAQDVHLMSADEIKKLSPAEKFDLLRGDYFFSLTREVIAHSKPTAQDWEGICQGWVQASIHHPRAKAITLRNKFGLSIPFGASDIHALYSYYYAKVKRTGVTLVGERCREDNIETPRCQDINPGSFHLIMTNFIALKKKSFAIDVQRGRDVWNQPAHSYRSTLLEERAPSYRAAYGTAKEVRVKTEFTYLDEGTPAWIAPSGSQKDSRVYEYWLELDQYNSIVGGSWISKERPDFVWTETKGKFEGDFALLKALLP